MRPGTDLGASVSVAELARTRGLELLRFAYLLCGDRQHAEDLLQEVLLSMYRRFPQQLPLENPVGYARRALANAEISRARRRSSGEVVLASLPERSVAEADGPAERDALWQALRRLPARQRTVLVLRYYLDATDEQISTMLGCRRGTVRSLASRALSTLRDDPNLAGNDADGGAW
jgi:RNA polymerase sigma-70 factor (sigma-E family)